MPGVVGPGPLLVDSVPPITIRERRALHRGNYEPGGAVIAVAASKRAGRFTMRETYVLHEIAHHLSSHGALHGPEFAATSSNVSKASWVRRTGFLLCACLLDSGVRIG